VADRTGLAAGPLALGAALLTGALAAACGGDESAGSGRTVVLGAVIDQTGSIARPAWKAAVELAIDDANAGLRQAGGYHDLVFELGFTDSTNDPTVALMRGTELVRIDAAKGLVADTSADDIELNRTHYDDDPNNDLGVPIICMACTSPSINNAGAADPADLVKTNTWRNAMGWNFRTSADSDPEAVALLNAAHGLGNAGDTNSDGKWKISVYAIDDAYGNGFFAGFERGRDANYPGLILEKVNHPRQVDANTHDWAGDLSKLTDDRNEQTAAVDGRPDAIVEVTFPLFAASITRSYIDAGNTVAAIPFLHHHNWRHDQTLVKLQSVDIDGHIGVSHAVLDNCEQSGQTFRSALLARTGKKPGFWDAQAYDAMMSLALATVIALHTGGLTDPIGLVGAQLRDAMPAISRAGGEKIYAGAAEFARAVAAIRAGGAIDYEGPSGPLDFDALGNVRNKFVLFEVVANDFTDKEAYDCVADLASCPTVAACPN
jgi:hypothetical protein